MLPCTLDVYMFQLIFAAWHKSETVEMRHALQPCALTSAAASRFCADAGKTGAALRAIVAAEHDQPTWPLLQLHNVQIQYLVTFVEHHI